MSHTDQDTYDDEWDTWGLDGSVSGSEEQTSEVTTWGSDGSVSGSREQTSEVTEESEDSEVRSITST